MSTNARKRWSKDELKNLRLLCNQSTSKKELKEKFGLNKSLFDDRNWSGVQAQCRKHPSLIHHFGDQFTHDFIDFLVKSRTIEEIIKKFKIEISEAKELLESLPKGYRLITQLNEVREKTFILLPNLDLEVELKPKIWEYILQKDGEPYVVIDFSKAKSTDKWNKINIVPISDAHIGDPGHDEATFDEYLNWIANNDEVFAFFNGNIFKKFTKAEQKDGVISARFSELKKKLARISHKILWAQAGTNEAACEKLGFDPLEMICKDFDIPYFDEPVYVDILWKGHTFTFFCIHGRSQAQTRGGKFNAALRPLAFQDFTMFTIMGHIKDKIVNPITKIQRDAENFTLKKLAPIVIVCPGFKKYFGSEEARKGYKPPSIGTVSCRLHSDGTYATSN